MLITNAFRCLVRTILNMILRAGNTILPLSVGIMHVMHTSQPNTCQQIFIYSQRTPFEIGYEMIAWSYINKHAHALDRHGAMRASLALFRQTMCIYALQILRNERPMKSIVSTTPDSPQISAALIQMHRCTIYVRGLTRSASLC